MSEQKTWREHAHDQIAELETDISAVKRKIEKFSNDTAKLNALIFQLGQYEYAQRTLYQLIGRVGNEQKAPDY